MEIKSRIIFGDSSVKKAYEELSSQRFQELQLKKQIETVFEKLENNAFSGTQIPKKLIPQMYQVRFGPLDNLWKHNLPRGWRLLYTVKNNEIVVLSIVLEWMDHKEYERRFKY
ncbi:MAG TPA: type II toxin-antitoxin system RelE/ParE family toxin [Candidatus Nanoarchaeia archaeon]|nr:type II toxin-antitoxin system RelE/ParE family toxin [Candidatus Nanoarchaeia archaeon]